MAVAFGSVAGWSEGQYLFFVGCYFALEGLAGLLDTLSLVQRELNPRLTIAGMVVTRIRSGSIRRGRRLALLDARARARGAGREPQ